VVSVGARVGGIGVSLGTSVGGTAVSVGSGVLDGRAVLVGKGERVKVAVPVMVAVCDKVSSCGCVTSGVMLAVMVSDRSGVDVTVCETVGVAEPCARRMVKRRRLMIPRQ